MPDRQKRNPDALSNIFYQTSRTRHGFEAMMEVIEYGWERKYCKATRLFGPPGIGKTQTLTYFDQIVCRPKGWKMLTLEVAPNCTRGTKLGEHFLEGLGDPNPEYGSEGDKLRRAKDAVEDQGYDVIALEEFHRLIDDKTDRVNHAVGHWVTGFLNMRACPLILVGELSTERVLQGNDMLDQRTFPGCVLTPYDWGDERDQKEFRQTLHAIDVALGMPERSGLGTVETAKKIYLFAGGLLRRSADLIAKARRLAKQQGLPKLTDELLANVVDEFLAVSPPGKVNPFRTEGLSTERVVKAVADRSRRDRGREAA